MKKILITATALFALTACNDKIAFVDNAKLLDDYQETKDIKNKFQGIKNAYDKKIHNY